MVSLVSHRMANHISQQQLPVTTLKAGRITNFKILAKLSVSIQSLIIYTWYLRGYSWWQNCTGRE